MIRLVRRAPAGPGERRWNPDDPHPELLTGVDAVIHLAGASIAGRFTDEHRRAIRDSRVGPTRRLAELAAATGLETFVSASAIGFYGACPGGPVTEESGRGDGFLADVVAQWEDAAAAAEQAGVRVVRVRTGVVQSPRGGILRVLAPLFRLGLGGRVGDGAQWLSWIGIDDLVDIYLRALWDTDLTGPVNAVAPEPVRNSSTPARSRGCCTGPRCCRSPRPARGCCSVSRAPARWRWRANMSHPPSSGGPGTVSVTPIWSPRCGTCWADGGTGPEMH